MAGRLVVCCSLSFAAIWALLFSDNFGKTYSDAYTTTVIEGVAFGELSTLVETESTVLHLESDINVPGRLLFSDHSALKLFDRVDGTQTLVGNATDSGYLEGVGESSRFKYISGFTQINTSAITVADATNKCVRLVDRDTLRTEQMIGVCGTYDVLRYPVAVIITTGCQVLNKKLLILDGELRSLIEVDMSTNEISSKPLAGLIWPNGMALDKEKKRLLITDLYSVSQYDLQTGNLTQISGSRKTGCNDGPLESAEYATPRSPVFYSKEVVMVVDGCSKIKVLNLRDASVSSFGRGTSAVNGPLAGCRFCEPKSALLSDGVMYIGELQGIRAVPYFEWGACFINNGKCLQAKGTALANGSRLTQDCPSHCNSALFTKAPSGCPFTALQLISTKASHHCAARCLATDLCTGYMYDMGGHVCHLVDGYLPMNHCSPSYNGTSWVKVKP